MSQTVNSPAEQSFSLPPTAYDQMVNWPRRLEREGPFFRRLFDQADVQSVLDLACGTGHHAALFATWGLNVTGTDADPQMVAHAAAQHGETQRLRWQALRMEDLNTLRQDTYSAITCLGNSLEMLPDRASVRSVCKHMVRLLAPRGIGMLHLLNLWKLPEGPITWQKHQRLHIGDAQHVILKGVHRAGDRGFVDVIVQDLNGEQPAMQASSSALLALEADELKGMLLDAGCTTVQLFGDHGGASFDRATSTDLIAVARK